MRVLDALVPCLVASQRTKGDRKRFEVLRDKRDHLGIGRGDTASVVLPSHRDVIDGCSVRPGTRPHAAGVDLDAPNVLAPRIREGGRLRRHSVSTFRMEDQSKLHHETQAFPGRTVLFCNDRLNRVVGAGARSLKSAHEGIVGCVRILRGVVTPLDTADGRHVSPHEQDRRAGAENHVLRMEEQFRRLEDDARTAFLAASLFEREGGCATSRKVVTHEGLNPLAKEVLVFLCEELEIVLHVGQERAELAEAAHSRLFSW